MNKLDIENSVDIIIGLYRNKTSSSLFYLKIVKSRSNQSAADHPKFISKNKQIAEYYSVDNSDDKF